LGLNDHFYENEQCDDIRETPGFQTPCHRMLADGYGREYHTEFT
jgi:hypothetical protein